ncbi:hypothetical protein CRG98_007422 [Punica granatum]|uniref:Uncharacterized protein n=1 Tax=Punica granatum TaxID=22663 RepID=A0A2I0KUT0_PUNGR|nr:hypothetical protein CRG98_007422 [Punica granatum]
MSYLAFHFKKRTLAGALASSLLLCFLSLYHGLKKNVGGLLGLASVHTNSSRWTSSWGTPRSTWYLAPFPAGMLPEKPRSHQGSENWAKPEKSGLKRPCFTMGKMMVTMSFDREGERSDDVVRWGRREE